MIQTNEGVGIRRIRYARLAKLISDGFVTAPNISGEWVHESGMRLEVSGGKVIMGKFTGSPISGEVFKGVVVGGAVIGVRFPGEVHQAAFSDLYRNLISIKESPSQNTLQTE